jgi:hypothetical protein
MFYFFYNYLLSDRIYCCCRLHIYNSCFFLFFYFKKYFEFKPFVEVYVCMESTFLSLKSPKMSSIKINLELPITNSVLCALSRPPVSNLSDWHMIRRQFTAHSSPSKMHRAQFTIMPFTAVTIHRRFNSPRHNSPRTIHREKIKILPEEFLILLDYW